MATYGFSRPQVFSSQIGAAGSVERCDPLRLSLYGVLKMTKEEAQTFLKKLGITAVTATDEIVEKIEDAKAELDTETRRKVRAFWLCVTGLAVVAGIGIGALI